MLHAVHYNIYINEMLKGGHKIPPSRPVPSPPKKKPDRSILSAGGGLLQHVDCLNAFQVVSRTIARPETESRHLNMFISQLGNINIIAST